MTGIYTGSAGHEYVEQFVAEGHDKKVSYFNYFSLSEHHLAASELKDPI